LCCFGAVKDGWERGKNEQTIVYIILTDNQVSRVIVTRDGLYGNVIVSISSGYPEDAYAGFTKGKVEPSVSSLNFHGNIRELEFSIQVRLSFRDTFAE
jgi:hypothetical protein